MTTKSSGHRVSSAARDRFNARPSLFHSLKHRPRHVGLILLPPRKDQQHRIPDKFEDLATTSLRLVTDRLEQRVHDRNDLTAHSLRQRRKAAHITEHNPCLHRLR